MRVYASNSDDSHSCFINSCTYSIDFSYVFPPTSCKWRAMNCGFNNETLAKNSDIHAANKHDGYNYAWKCGKENEHIVRKVKKNIHAILKLSVRMERSPPKKQLFWS